MLRLQTTRFQIPLEFLLRSYSSKLASIIASCLLACRIKANPITQSRTDAPIPKSISLRTIQVAAPKLWPKYAAKNANPEKKS